MADLEPGPELDALVAEKVMGWVRRKGSWYEIFCNDGEGYWIRGIRRADLESMFDFFFPSTSIADAMRDVVPAVLRRGEVCPEFTLNCEWWLHEKGPVWFAEFEMEPGGPAYEGRGDGEAAAGFAICLAALRSVGHEIDQPRGLLSDSEG